VFIAQAAAGSTPARLVKNQDLAAVVWTSEGAVRALTGPAEPDRLSRIAGRLGALWPVKSSP
jgi:hypothetical protein